MQPKPDLNRKAALSVLREYARSMSLDLEAQSEYNGNLVERTVKGGASETKFRNLELVSPSSVYAI